jgi:hypothetical protein
VENSDFGSVFYNVRKSLACNMPQTRASIMMYSQRLEQTRSQGPRSFSYPYGCFFARFGDEIKKYL